MTSLLFALILFTPPAEKVWLQGHLMSMTRTTEAHTGGVFVGGQGSVGTRQDAIYTLTIAPADKDAPVLEVIHEPRRDKMPNVIENDAIQYRIEGRDLFVLDRDHKEIKCRIVKMRKP